MMRYFFPCPNFIIRNMVTAFCHSRILSSSLFHPHFVIRVLSSAFCHPHFIIRHPPSAIRRHPVRTLQTPPGWSETLWELSVLPKNTTQCPRPWLEPACFKERRSSTMKKSHIVIKCTPSFTKSPSLVEIDPIISKIQPFKNIKIYKKNYGHPDAVSGWPNIFV